MALGFNAQITEIDFSGGIGLCTSKSRSPIEGPHWRLDSAAKPACYLSSGGLSDYNTNPHVANQLTVSLKLQSSSAINEEFTLIGTGRNFEIRSFPFRINGTSVVQTKVDCMFWQLPSQLYRDEKAAIQWKLVSSSGTTPLNTTVVSLFFIFNYPRAIWGHATINPYIYVEALDFAFRAIGVDNQTGISKSDALAKLTSYLFSKHNVRYDVGLQIHMPVGGNYFFIDLLTYLERGYAFVNCNMQAGVLALLANAIGVAANMVEIDSFGYIDSQLVGVGRCNNPFYRDTNIQVRRTPYVSAICAKKTFFLKHSVVSYDNKIYDATVGPYLGLLNPLAYFNNAIVQPPDGERNRSPSMSTIDNIVAKI